MKLMTKELSFARLKASAYSAMPHKILLNLKKSTSAKIALTILINTNKIYHTRQIFMIKIYIASINNIDLKRICEIDADRACKVDRLRLYEDKKRCVAGGLFIKKFLGDANISLNEFGKPTADNGLYFNISHSSEYVLFALSDKEIGCDIEKSRKIEPEKLGKIVFCENEMNAIKKSADKQQCFFDLWTRKESLLKCIGKGFHQNSKSVDVSRQPCQISENTYYFRMWHKNGCTASVCSEYENIPENIEFIRL